MMDFRFMTTDGEFVQLIRLIADFTFKTDTPFWKSVLEVASTFVDARRLTLLAVNEEGKVEGYLHGYFMSDSEFMITQTNYQEGRETLTAFLYLEKTVAERGGKEILALTHLPPEKFSQYGLSLKRYVISKTI